MMNGPAVRRLLLLCTGNTCRSPMAAGIFRELLRRRQLAGGVEVRTAGLVVAYDGEGASPHAGQALAERGIDLGPHQARQLTLDDIDWAQVILTMGAAHKAQVLRMAPWAADRTFVLREYTTGESPGDGGEMSPWCCNLDVPDPIGRGLDAYRAVASLLEKELARLVELIAGEEASALTAITAAGPGAIARPEPATMPSEVEWAATRSLAIGADHAGYEMKQELSAVAAAMGYEIVDFGATGSAPVVDYPDFAVKVSAAVASKRCNLGLLVCGTGIGMAIAANKIRGIRAATCNDLFLARMAREHNDANVLCLGARVIGGGVAAEVLRTFLSTPFGGERHARRVCKIEDLEPPATAGKELCQ